MRRTGKRAFAPTIGRDGTSHVEITYSIFIACSLEDREPVAVHSERPAAAGEEGVFSHEGVLVSGAGGPRQAVLVGSIGRRARRGADQALVGATRARGGDCRSALQGVRQRQPLPVRRVEAHGALEPRALRLLG